MSELSVVPRTYMYNYDSVAVLNYYLTAYKYQYENL